MRKIIFKRYIIHSKLSKNARHAMILLNHTTYKQKCVCSSLSFKGKKIKKKKHKMLPLKALTSVRFARNMQTLEKRHLVHFATSCAVQHKELLN